jgi:hypothetical protein
MFRSSTTIRELVLSLAKVMLEHLCPYRLCGGVAACLGSGVCVVQNETVVVWWCGSMSWSGVCVVCCAE